MKKLIFTVFILITCSLFANESNGDNLKSKIIALGSKIITKSTNVKTNNYASSCSNLNHCIVEPSIKRNTPNDAFMTSGCAKGNGNCCYLTEVVNECNKSVDFYYCFEKTDGKWTCGLTVVGAGKSKKLSASAWTYDCSGGYETSGFESPAYYTCVKEWKNSKGITD